MTEILLTSEAFIKSVLSISDNLAGKYILPALREAQEVNLRGIVGSCLLESVKEKVAAGTIDDIANAAYKELLNQAKYYLAYQTGVKVMMKISYKLTNFGVAKSTDENLVVASHDEIVKVQYEYQTTADDYCLMLQGWLLDNKAAFPELGDCDCAKIKSNLYSSATCGLWLGGRRGKGSAKNPCSCSKR